MLGVVDSKSYLAVILLEISTLPVDVLVAGGSGRKAEHSHTNIASDDRWTQWRPL